MKTLAKWLLVGVCLAVILGIVLSLDDDELRPEVKRAIERTTETPEPSENGYFAMLAGIDVGVEDDPWEVGRALAESYEQTLATGSVELADYPDTQRLPLPDTVASLCSVELAPCLAVFAETTGEIGSNRPVHDVLLERYLDLYDYQHFVSTNTPTFDQPLPRLVPLIKTHRLLIAVLGVQFMSGKDEQALAALAKDILFQRRLLAQADNLLLKMVALTLLGQDIHLYAQMLDVEGFPYDHLAVRKALHKPHPDELSLRTALESEFKASAHLFLFELRRQDVLTKSSQPADGSASWVSKAITLVAFKPNATVNTVYDQILGTERKLAGKSAPELSAYWAASDQSEEEPAGAFRQVFAWPFNPIGNLLTSISAPSYKQYLARLYDLHGLLRLVELKRIVRRLHIASDKVKPYVARQRTGLVNPYTLEPMRYDENRAVMYFEGLSATGDANNWRTRLPLYDIVSWDTVLN